jgi:hypothetical protein
MEARRGDCVEFTDARGHAHVAWVTAARGIRHPGRVRVSYMPFVHTDMEQRFERRSRWINPDTIIRNRDADIRIDAKIDGFQPSGLGCQSDTW